MRHAQFIKSIRGSDPILNDGIPQVAFIGRSNSGKSSVIQSFLGIKKLVRSSARPGQTQMINFFLVEGKCYFVDLPGYGYARLSFQKREKLNKLIAWYLERSGAFVRLLVLIIDARRGLCEGDKEILSFARGIDLPVIVVANKIDQMARSEYVAAEKEMRTFVGANQTLFLYSAKTEEGKKPIEEYIEDRVCKEN